MREAMTTQICEALRFHGRYAAETQDECTVRKNAEREKAADLITSQAAEIERLTEELRASDWHKNNWHTAFEKQHARALAAEAALEKMRWLPIETAPKDGTEILLWSSIGDRSKDGPTVGHWSTKEECQTYLGDCGGECRCPEYEYCDPLWLSWDGGFLVEYPPTHWMPLPIPPGLTTQGGVE